MEKEKLEEKIIYHPERCVFMETSKLLNSTLDLKELLDLILKSITKAMEASFSSISLYDRKAQELDLYLYSGESKEEKKELRL